MSFKALLTRKTDDGVSTELVDFDEANLMDGDVLVQVEYSTLNYKDALALTHSRPVMRTYPLIPGIDLAGVVLESSNAGFKTGDRVVLNGWDLSMGHHGGLAQRARVRGEWLNKIPGNLTTRDAMAIGTAGYTAMLCVLALEDADVTPEKGDVLVTGANGGVGSIAVAILSKLGYRVVAATGRPEHAEYLHSLGAAEIIDRAQFSEPRDRPVSKERWAGVVDVAGGPTLVNAIAETKYRGAVAACGLAQSDALHGSVIPFILRNVTLAGVDSVNAPQDVRQRAWDRLATDLDLQKLESTVQQIGLAEVLDVYEQIIPGKVRGRIVVDVNA
ncbi:oxidoreductase [Stenotrophomonas maltophilia]|uniref:acrylyl-CoA reductase (NADPH) n=1 Tax=Stenotrophomonas maltophilia group TaxID=995085 RepID=UPI0015DDDB2A|nr:MDR family oxidoreductase [Stenotrophomonas maltophilia]MBA0436218.1 oxidoreductase [Stenotrophomonas maltophilia]MDZ5814944.1 MDR family oxidoreductase [Stenotrophomonas maltophilia]